MIRERKRRLNYQFRDALNSMSVAVQAGYSVENAVKESLKEMQVFYSDDAAILRELEIMVRQIRVQVPVEQAVEELSERTKLPDVESFAGVFVTAKRSGGNLMSIIRNTADQIGDKIDVKREIDTMLAEKKYEHPSPEQVEEVRHEEGLDQPVLVQYGKWLEQALHGDFGKSYSTRKPAFEELKRYFPQTFKLAVTSFLLLMIVSVPLGILSAIYENRVLDKVIRILSSLSVSMPSFWIGLMLLYIFGVKLKVISVIGGDAGGIPILAAFAMDISFFGIMTRLIRTNMIQVLKQDYIRASRAKGLSSVNVILRHGLKNILIPVLTRLVSIVIGFFCGSAVIESIFSIQGIGNLALKSVISKDTPVLQCFIFILAVGIVVLNFLVDIAYSAIDRRIQLK